MPNHVQIYESSESPGMKCNKKYTPGHRCLTPQRCVIEHSWRTLPIKNQRHIWTRSTPRFPYMQCQGGHDQKLRIMTIMAKASSTKPTKFECWLNSLSRPWHGRGVAAGVCVPCTLAGHYAQAWGVACHGLEMLLMGPWGWHGPAAWLEGWAGWCPRISVYILAVPYSLCCYLV